MQAKPQNPSLAGKTGLSSLCYVGNTPNTMSRGQGGPQAASPSRQGPEYPCWAARLTFNGLSYIGKDPKAQFRGPGGPQIASPI